MTVDVEKFVDGLHSYLGKALTPIGARLAAVEQRLASVEKAPLAYCGVHESGRRYDKNAIVTHSGGMWCALRETQQKPGDGGDAWQLCVKPGRDAK
ncbi:MAG: hypothetical protein OEM00_10950 [Burkholderiaceae bacterium]|nr:hypothetical protein [Burkholderiaceae bacterium]